MMIVLFYEIQRFLANFLIKYLIDTQQLKLYQTIDWEKEVTRFQALGLTYPSYYTSVNFHGINQGYLNPVAALTYDAVTSWATLFGEKQLRQGLIHSIKGEPQTILDLGCGTGSMTIELKKTFSNAYVIGLDLSAYMLVMAEDKAKQQTLNIEWKQGLAEATTFPDSSFDVITISMLLHETPPHISLAILKEAYRLLTWQGQLMILDGNQQRLRHVLWLAKLFREPYSPVYSQGDIRQWLKSVGFQDVQMQPQWGIYQVSHSMKHLF